MKVCIDLLRTFLIAVITVTCVSCDSGELLQLRLKTGDRWQLETTTRANIDQTSGERKEEHLQEFTFTQDVEVIETTDKSIRLSATFRQVRHVLDRGRRRQMYDSTTATSTPFLASKPFVPLVGKKIEIVLSPDGRILGVDGGAELREKMVQALRDDMKSNRDPDKELFLTQVAEQFSDIALIEMFEPFFGFLPSEPTSVGDEWVIKQHVSKAFPMTRIERLKFDAKKDSLAQLSSHAEIVPNEKQDFLQIGPSKVYFKLNGKQTGKLEFDVATGVLRSATWTLEAKGDQIAKTPTGDSKSEIMLRLQRTAKVTPLRST